MLFTVLTFAYVIFEISFKIFFYHSDDIAEIKVGVSNLIKNKVHKVKSTLAHRLL